MTDQKLPQDTQEGITQVASEDSRLPPRPRPHDSRPQSSKTGTLTHKRSGSRAQMLMNKDSDLNLSDEEDTIIAGKQQQLPEEKDQYFYARFKSDQIQKIPRVQSSTSQKDGRLKNQLEDPATKVEEPAVEGAQSHSHFPKSSFDVRNHTMGTSSCLADVIKPELGNIEATPSEQSQVTRTLASVAIQGAFHQTASDISDVGVKPMIKEEKSAAVLNSNRQENQQQLEEEIGVQNQEPVEEDPIEEAGSPKQEATEEKDDRGEPLAAREQSPNWQMQVAESSVFDQKEAIFSSSEQTQALAGQNLAAQVSPPLESEAEKEESEDEPQENSRKYIIHSKKSSESSSSTPQPDKGSAPMTDEIVFSRLPQNYFVQDQESMDLDEVVGDLKKMKQGLVDYVEEKQVFQELNQISQALDPSKFMERHFGEMQDPAFMFEEVITKVPEPKNIPSEKLLEVAQQNFSLPQDDEITGVEKEDAAHQEHDNNTADIQVQKPKDETEHISQEPDETIEEPQQPAITHQENAQYELPQTKIIRKKKTRFVKRQPFQARKMGEYFKQSSADNSIISSEFAQNEVKLPVRISTVENLEEKLEADVIDDLNVNFMFRKGQNLFTGLIDENRIYQITSKLKSLATRSTAQGSSHINYQEIVDYVKSKEHYDLPNTGGFDDTQMREAEEPPMIGETAEEAAQRRWQDTVTFLRANPKLLLQMIPDAEEFTERVSKPKGKLHKKMEEAQKRSKKQTAPRSVGRKNLMMADKHEIKPSGRKSSDLTPVQANFNSSFDRYENHGVPDNNGNLQLSDHKKLLNRGEEIIIASSETPICGTPAMNFYSAKTNPYRVKLSKNICSKTSSRPQTSNMKRLHIQSFMDPATLLNKRLSPTGRSQQPYKVTSQSDLARISNPSEAGNMYRGFISGLEGAQLSRQELQRVFTSEQAKNAGVSISNNARPLSRPITANAPPSRLAQKRLASNHILLKNVSQRRSANFLYKNAKRVTSGNLNQRKVGSCFKNMMEPQYYQSDQNSLVQQESMTYSAEEKQISLNLERPPDTHNSFQESSAIVPAGIRKKSKSPIKDLRRDLNSSPYREKFIKKRGQNAIPQTKSRCPPYFKAEKIQREKKEISVGHKIEQAPPIDWAFSPLCLQMLKNETEFNKDREIKVFMENEINYVIDMMKSKFQDFKQTDIMQPFYTKALETLRALLDEQHMGELFKKFSKQYQEVTIENTLKLMLRCKLAFHSRKVLLKIFEYIMAYELTARDIKTLLDSLHSYKIEQGQYTNLRKESSRMFEASEKVLQQIKLLRADKNSHYRQTFVFKKKDLVKFIKHEVAEIRKLTQVFRVKRSDESVDSEKPARYERSDSSDSNQ